MKRILFCSVIISLQTFACDPATIIAVDSITLNREEFEGEFGKVKRGLMGCYSDLFPPLCNSMMRKDLKEKYLLYNGVPLAQHPNADQLLRIFLSKNNITICPLRKIIYPSCPRHMHTCSVCTDNKVSSNPHQHNIAPVEFNESSVGLCLFCLSAGIGLVGGLYLKAFEGIFVGLIPFCGLAVPVLSSGEDSFVLLEWARRNGKLSAGPRSLEMSEDTAKKDD